MKRNTLLSLVAIALSLFAISCSSTYDASPDIPGKDKIRNPLQGDFTAQVGGVLFRANSKYIIDQSNDNIRSVSISGVQDSYDKDPKRNQTISLTIPDYIGPKTYMSDEGFTGTFINIDTVRTYSYLTIPGDTFSRITITADGNNWEGSFDLIVVPITEDTYDTLVISNGSFNIPK